MIALKTSKKIPTELCENYFTNLVGRIYKLLPLKEESSTTLDSYFRSLLNEMTGNQELILLLQNDGQYMAVLGTLEYLRHCDDILFYRSEVFKCINIINNLKIKYFKAGVSDAD